MKYIKENFNYLLFAFSLVSILSWIFEIEYSLVIRDKLVSPGVWHGPYCPIYGLTFVLICAVFRKSDNIFINIIKIAITVIVTEYAISLLSEAVFHHLIWNYSKKYLNINGRVCLEMSTIFTIVGTIVMYIIEPLMRKLYDKLGKSVKYINIVLSTIMIVDMIITLINV